MASFIENVNSLANNLELIQKGTEFYTPEILASLESLSGLDLGDVTNDLKKGTLFGNRKIDIDLSLNKVGISALSDFNEIMALWTDTTTSVYYNQAVATFVDGEVITIDFKNEDGQSEVVSTHGGIVDQLEDNVAFQAKIKNTSIQEEVGGKVGSIIRISDIVGFASNLEEIRLVVASGAAVEASTMHYWAKTTSALQVVADKMGHVADVSNNITEVNALGASIDAVLGVYAKLSQIAVIYSNILDVNAVAADITSVASVADDLAAIDTIMLNLNAVKTAATNINNINIVALDSAKINTIVSNITALGASTATAISSTNMTLNGSVISFGATDKEALSIGFEYRVVGETIWSATAMVAKGTLGDFSASISGLSITTNYEFRAKATDSLNPSLVAYSEVATAMTTSNAIPTDATNTGSFASQLAKGSVTGFTFSGATDSDGTVTHYLVDNISSANLTVTTAEVAAGTAHTFNVSGSLSADEVVTFSVKAKNNAGSYSAGVSVSVTLKNVFIATPTLTVTGTPTDVPETPTLTTSAFSVNGGTDTHASTSWYVKQGGITVWSSVADTVNLLSITVPVGVLSVSTAYTFEAYHTGATYGNSGTVSVSGTTKSAFAPEQGQKGFGIEPMQAGAPYAVLGLAEMDGTNTVGHDNYGNYIHTNGSIVCHYPKKYYRVGHPDAPQYATYGANSLEMVSFNTFANEAEANAAGWALHRAFIDGGTEQNGFVRFKYLASKSATDANKAVSVKNGNPIGLTTNTSYNPSSTMTGCTGILADAVTLSRAIGAGWNNESVFMVGWSAMISIAQAQRATSAVDVAWYDASGVMNFPKGCNNGARADVNDTSVTWSASPNDAAKGLTGSASNFAKSTDNGANNGCADVNGLMYQVALGMTNYGTSATSTTQITTNTIYVLKKTAYLKDLTAGWDGATDAWGNTTNLATRYDAVTSPITVSATGSVYWGSGANQVLSPDTTGVAHDLCGFLPKNDAAADATGTSQFGNDYMYKYNRQNMYPRTAGDGNDSATAGAFYRYLSDYRSTDRSNDGFRAAAYVS